MKNQEILFKEDSNRFDTRKGLNRASGVKIPLDIVEKIETEGLTSEILDTLTIPIFKYKTQITLHGEFDININTRVGGYKNLLLNGNKTLGVKYNAIDYLKKVEISKVLKGYGFHFDRNSLGDSFVYSTREKDKVIEVYNKINISDFYATKNATYINFYGSITYYVIINLMSIYQSEILKFICSVTGETETQVEKMIFKINEDEKIERLLWEKRQEEYRIEREKKQKELQDLSAPMKEQISHLSDCNDPHLGTLVKVVYKKYISEPDKLKFMYFRLNGKGSFGRLKIQKAYSDTFQTENLTFEDQIERKLSELKLSGFKLIKK